MKPQLLAGCVLTVALTSLVAQAQLREDALVQSPQIARPARGTLGSSLAGFELGPAALSRGSASLPTPFAIPTERGGPALSFLPSYSADLGLSEWGVGWGASITIRRFRPVGAIDYATDRFASPWGTLTRGDDGAYYADGLEPRVRLELASGAWTATTPDGTRVVFRSTDALTTPLGTYEWWPSEATALSGERTSFEHAVGTGGRRYLTRVRYGGRAGVPQTEVSFAYTTLAVPFVDRRSGTAVPLDRRVESVVVAMWDPESSSYLERYRYELGYLVNPAGVASYLETVRRVFPSGEAEPTVRYSYRFGEDDALAATVEEAPVLADYLARFGSGSLVPSEAAYLDVDRDGRTDLENPYDHELALHTDSGLEFEPLERDGTELALCRPAVSTGNDPRTLVRLWPSQTEPHVVRFYRPAADTVVYDCDRQGHMLSFATLSGDWRAGANTRLVDVDRDLRPDLVRVVRGAVDVRKNTSVGTLSFGASSRQTLSPAFTPSRTWVNDLTGDGVPDLVGLGYSSLYVWAGLGNGSFETAARRLMLRTASGGEFGSIETSNVVFVDANRDGLTDVLVSSGPTLRLLTHRGDSFRQIAVPAFGSLTWDSSYPITVDLEGRGEEQAVVSAGALAYAITFTSPSAGLLVSADDGRGGGLTLSYERAPATPGIVARPPLVSFLRVSDAAFDPIEYRYDYEDPVFHSEGEYLVGYRLVRRASPTAVEEVSMYHDDSQSALPLATRAFDTLTTDLPAGLYRYSESEYEDAAFRGIAYKRPVVARSGLRDAAGNEVRASLTRTTEWSSDGLCALTSVVENDQQRLVSSRTLAAPSELAGALHCLFETETETGEHDGRPELDFEYRARVARTPIGQVERVELLEGETVFVAQVNTYDAQHRLIVSAAPGRGATTASYHPITGDPIAVISPDGVRTSVLDRVGRSAAITAIAEDRGATVTYDSHFGYDGLERLAHRYDNVGASSAARPDELLSYAYASAARPASIVARVLADAAADVYTSEASWLSAGGASIATATAIPEGWAVGGVEVPTRTLARVDHYRRDPITGDAHTIGFSELFDASHSTRLETSTSSLFGHSPRSETIVQAGVIRTSTQELAIESGELARRTFENGTLLGTERVDGDGRTTSRTDAAGETTSISHDALGRLVDVRLPGGARQSLRFDGLGRARQVDRSDLGHIEYDYDPTSGLLSGKRFFDRDEVLVRRTDLVRDAAGREVVRRHVRASDGAEEVFSFLYDGRLPDGTSLSGQQGRLTSVRGPAYEARTVYRADGSPTLARLTIDGFREILTTYDYFEDGTLRSTARVVRDAAGAVLSSLARQVERDAYGRELRVTLDDGTPETLYELEYDGEGRVSRVMVAGDEEPLDMCCVVIGGELHCSHDACGSRELTSEIAALEGASPIPLYETSALVPLYDAVTHAQSGYTHETGGWTLNVEKQMNARGLVERESTELTRGGTVEVLDRSYTYDARRFLARSDSSTDSSYAYASTGLLSSADDLRGARAIVRHANEIIAGTVTYRVDRAGRIVSRDDLTLEYGASGDVARATRGSRAWTFDYDDAGQRLVKREGGAPVALYLPGGLFLDASHVVEPVVAAGQIVGVLVNGQFRARGADPRGTIVNDEHGTAIDSSPFGARVTHPELAAALDYAQAGYDADLEVVRLGVRDLDPYLGQFRTPDPLYLEDLGRCASSAVDCSLYAYATNDPVSFVDPSGTEPLSQAQADAAASVARTATEWGTQLREWARVTESMKQTILTLRAQAFAAEVSSLRERSAVHRAPSGTRVPAIAEAFDFEAIGEDWNDAEPLGRTHETTIDSFDLPDIVRVAERGGNPFRIGTHLRADLGYVGATPLGQPQEYRFLGSAQYYLERTAGRSRSATVPFLDVSLGRTTDKMTGYVFDNAPTSMRSQMVLATPIVFLSSQGLTRFYVGKQTLMFFPVP
jgi:RHS repeat-associated protein